MVKNTILGLKKLFYGSIDINLIILTHVKIMSEYTHNTHFDQIKNSQLFFLCRLKML